MALGALLSWRDGGTVVWAGVAIVAVAVVLARTVPPGARFWHVGAGYAYALCVLATALLRLGVAPIALLCLTTVAAGLGAIVATFVPAVRPRAWWAVLAVTSVPFVVGVVQVVFERSGWTALSTGVIFLLALTLVHTRRPGLGVPLRFAAAALVVPSVAVVAVCLGAQLLTVSGAPVVLPVISTLVALVLPAVPTIRSTLGRRVPIADAAAAAFAIEASALLTAAVTVALALLRESAGLGTTLLVLAIMGVGAAAAAQWAHRRYGWWLAGAAFSGALWSGWGMAGITVVEPYLLPPALGAALIAVVRVTRGGRGVPLYAAGLAVAVVPVLAVLALSGSGTGPAWRGYALVGASWVLAVIGMLLGRSPSAGARRRRTLSIPTFAVAIVAGAAGAVQAVRWATGVDAWAFASAPPVLVCLAAGAAGALPAVLAARGMLSRARAGSALAATRWLHAPAAVFVTVAAWPAIGREWLTICAMWALMLALLLSMLAIAVRGRGRSTGLPRYG